MNCNRSRVSPRFRVSKCSEGSETFGGSFGAGLKVHEVVGCRATTAPRDPAVSKWTEPNFQEHFEFQHLQCGEQLLRTKERTERGPRPSGPNRSPSHPASGVQTMNRTVPVVAGFAGPVPRSSPLPWTAPPRRSCPGSGGAAKLAPAARPPSPPAAVPGLLPGAPQLDLSLGPERSAASRSIRRGLN